MVGQGNERVDFFVNGRTFIDALKSCHLSENFCRTLSGDCEVYSWDEDNKPYCREEK